MCLFNTLLLFAFSLITYHEVFAVFGLNETSIESTDEEMYMRVDDMIFLRPDKKAGLESEEFRWPNGVIPYKLQKGFSNEMYKIVRETMDVIEEFTCIEFVRREKQKDYLYISYTDRGCYAHVGFMNRGRQKLNLGRGCWSFGTVVHELIHSIGFSHEHQRNDRDKFVEIRYENMKPGKEHNFKLDKEMGMKFNYFGLPYNFASVMHYSKMAFSENGKPTIVPKKVWKIEDEALYTTLDEHDRPVIGLNELTWGDITMINRMYDDDYC